MISTKHMLVIALFLFFMFAGCVLPGKAKVYRNGNQHLVAVANTTALFKEMIAKHPHNVDVAKLKYLSAFYMEKFRAVCRFYRKYEAAHPGHHLRCVIKNNTLLLHDNINIAAPVLITSANDSPSDQWPTNFYKFSKHKEGDEVTYRVEYYYLPDLLINESEYIGSNTSVNRSSLALGWGNIGYTSTLPPDKVNFTSDQEQDILLFYVTMPGKIVNVSPGCAVKIINSTTIVFNLLSTQNNKCRNLWTLVNKTKTKDGRTLYNYEDKRVPLVIVSKENLSIKHVSKTAPNTTNSQHISTNQKPPAHPHTSTPTKHSVCLSTVLLLGILSLATVKFLNTTTQGGA